MRAIKFRLEEFLRYKNKKCYFADRCREIKKWFLFKVLHSKKHCHFCLKKFDWEIKYYCRECIEETL